MNVVFLCEYLAFSCSSHLKLRVVAETQWPLTAFASERDGQVQGGGVDGTPKVTENQAPNATIIVDTAQTINTGSDGTALTFTNPNERTIKVVCEDWTLNYSNSGFYSIQTSFRRVYEP